MITSRKFIGFAAACFATLSTPSLLAKENGCLASAQEMKQSCSFESNEEYRATKASCESIIDDDERRDCLADAKEERKEAGETCSDQWQARQDACDALDEDRYANPFTEVEGIVFIDPDEVGDGYPNNPYVKVQAGHTHLLKAEEDETVTELIVVHATDEVREIEGVLCRVVADIVLEPEFNEDEGKYEFEAIEVTDDWFAQDEDANVYYCGEVARNFEDGVLRDLDGSFESGLDLAEGGYLTKAAPLPGDIHRQEVAFGEAEDIVEYLSLMGTPRNEGVDETLYLAEDFQCGEAGSGECLHTFDFTPLEPESTEYKYYLPGTGLVMAIPLEEGEIIEGSVEYLVCAGDDLFEVLESEDCGIDEDYGEGAVEALLEALCELSNELCDDGEEQGI